MNIRLNNAPLSTTYPVFLSTCTDPESVVISNPAYLHEPCTEIQQCHDRQRALRYQLASNSQTDRHSNQVSEYIYTEEEEDIGAGNMSDIKVFVTFPESSTVFAGERLECKITFKNVSPIPGANRGAPPLHLQKPTVNGYGLPANGNAPGGVKNKGVPLQPPTGLRSGISPRVPTGRPSSGHKPSLSLSVPAVPKAPISPLPAPGTNGGVGHKHKRSISIVSLGSEVGIEGQGRGQGEDGFKSPHMPQGRTVRAGHGRSASIHTLPRRSPMLNGSTPNSGMD